MCLVAAALGEELPGGLGLGALGDHVEAEPAREVDRGVNDRRVAFVLGHPQHEGAVDLELVDVGLVEMCKRGMTNAEVIRRCPCADLAQAREHVHDALRVGHHDVLEDLELERHSREVAGVQQPLYLDRQAEVRQVRRAEVNRDRQIESFPSQLANLLQDAVEHELSQRARETALLGERKELRGREQRERRMRPTDQRPHATYDSDGQLDLGLVLDAKLSDLNRAAQLADQRQPLGGRSRAAM